MKISTHRLSIALVFRRGPPIKPALTKILRCAIHTRKSTEHNLDLAFNSLDAQREAARPV